jgi:hypothetical protein
MALELLSGPHPVVNSQTGVLSSYPTSASGQQAIWIDPVGLLIERAGNEGLDRILFDGSSFSLSSFSMPAGCFGLVLIDGDANVPDSGRKWYGFLTLPQFNIDPITGIPEYTPTKTDGPVLTYVASDFADLSDRWVQPLGANIRRYTGTSWATEISIPGMTNARRLSWASEIDSFWVSGSDGHVVRYNYRTQELTSPVYTIGMTNLGLWYSRKHGVFFSLHYEGGVFVTRVWSTTPLPAILSAPQTVDPVQSGRLVKIRAQLRGAHGENCQGEVVQWTVNGPGVISPILSETDSDGWAETNWAVPLGFGGSSADIIAEVRF